MAWNVKQQIADASPIETQWSVTNDGTYIYSAGHGYNGGGAQAYMVTEKRQISDGTLTWQKGTWGEKETYGLCVAQDGTRVFAAGENRTSNLGIIRTYLLNGNTSWSYIPTVVGVGICGYYNAIDVDDDYVYLVGPDAWVGDFHIEARNKTTGAQVWVSAVGSGGDQAVDVRVYDGYVYACGFLWDGAGGYTPRVVRTATDGTFDWGISDFDLAVTTYGYRKLDVDSTGIYIASQALFTGDSFILRKLALADGSTSWSVTVTGAITGPPTQIGVVNDVLLLGTKIYVLYSCDIGSGTQYIVESRNTSDGSFIAYDAFAVYTEAFLAITGLSNAPAADEIVAVGSYPQTDPSYRYSYWDDFLAATSGGTGTTLTLTLADGVVFSDSNTVAVGYNLILSDGIIISDSKSFGMSAVLSDVVIISETANATLRGIWTKIYNLISSDIWIKLGKVTSDIWTKKSKSSSAWVKK
jgi:hypothetical protein